MSRKRASMLVAAVAALAVAVGVIAVTRSGPERSAAAPRPSVSSTPPQRVVLPGRPGDTAKVTGSDQLQPAPSATFNTIDTTFVQMMIVHHGQALEMAELAPARAAGTELRAFADRIADAQQMEITYYRTWLRTRNLPEDAGHDHGTMPGMQTPAAMAALAAAGRADFDRTFITMMTAHHRGALQMAADVVKGGADEQLRELAEEMALEQDIEIQRMARLDAR